MYTKNISSKLNNVNRKKQKSTFILMYSQVIDQNLDTLSGTAFKLYYLLRTYSNNEFKPVFPSIKTLSIRLNCSEDTIRRCIKELVSVNLITIKKGKCNRNIYHFNEKSSVSNHSSEFETRSKYKPKTKQVKIRVQEEKHKEYLQKSENHVTKNLKLESINSTTTGNNKSNNTTNNHITSDVVVDNLNNKINNQQTITVYTKELSETHNKLTSKLSNPPEYKNIIPESFIKSLKNHYDLNYIKLLIDYTNWANAKVNTIRLPVKFITWLLKNPYEADFTEYFNYLNKIYIQEQAIKQEQEYKKQQQFQLQQEKDNTPSQEEMNDFFKQLKTVINKRE